MTLNLSNLSNNYNGIFEIDKHYSESIYKFSIFLLISDDETSNEIKQKLKLLLNYARTKDDHNYEVTNIQLDELIDRWKLNNRSNVEYYDIIDYHNRSDVLIELNKIKDIIKNMENNLSNINNFIDKHSISDNILSSNNCNIGIENQSCKKFTVRKYMKGNETVAYQIAKYLNSIECGKILSGKDIANGINNNYSSCAERNAVSSALSVLMKNELIGFKMVGKGKYIYWADCKIVLD